MAVDRAGQTVPVPIGLVEARHALQAVSGGVRALLAVLRTGLTDAALQEVVIRALQAVSQTHTDLAACRTGIASPSGLIEELADRALLACATRAM